MASLSLFMTAPLISPLLSQIQIEVSIAIQWDKNAMSSEIKGVGNASDEVHIFIGESLRSNTFLVISNAAGGGVDVCS